MKTKDSKLLLKINGKTVLERSVNAFLNISDVDEVIVVAREKDIPAFSDILTDERVSFVVGGDTRQQSVMNAVDVIDDCELIIIHDGARPFPDEEMLKRTLEAAKEYGACVAAVPSKDTIKVGTEEEMVEKTLDRKTLWNVQTPQVFQYDLICKAHREIRKGSMEGITDDSMIIEALGICPIKLVMGSYDNIKVTTPEDLVIAENILRKR